MLYFHILGWVESEIYTTSKSSHGLGSYSKDFLIIPKRQLAL